MMNTCFVVHACIHHTHAHTTALYTTHAHRHTHNLKQSLVQNMSIAAQQTSTGVPLRHLSLSNPSWIGLQEDY